MFVSTTSGSPTRSTTLPFFVTFSEPVTGFSASGVVVVGGTLQNFVGSPGSAVYTFDVTPSSSLVTVFVWIDPGAAIDRAGNPCKASTPVGIEHGRRLCMNSLAVS